MTENNKDEMSAAELESTFNFMFRLIKFASLIVIICFVLFSGQPDIHDSIIIFLNSWANKGVL